MLELLREMGSHNGVEYAAFFGKAIANGVFSQFIDKIVRSLLAGSQFYEQSRNNQTHQLIV